MFIIHSHFIQRFIVFQSVISFQLHISSVSVTVYISYIYIIIQAALSTEVKKYCYLPTHVAVSIWVRVRQPSMLPLVQFLNSENLILSHASCPVS